MNEELDVNFDQRQEFEAFCKRTNPAYKPTDDSVIDRAAWRIWREAWEAALNRAIDVMPGGSVTDPQWVCDKLRELGGTRGG